MSPLTHSELHGHRFTVIGASGFVGSSLAQVLQDRGAHVWLPGRQESWPRCEALGHVIYCAGLTADYLARPFDTVQAHVSHLAQVLQSTGWDSLVYLSSTRLYDSSSAAVAHEDAQLLLNPANPRHLYDLSKALGESLCHVAGQGKARVARLACVYDSPLDEDGFLPLLVRSAMAAKQTGQIRLEIESSPHFTRDYVHLPDVVEALIRIALHGRQAIYNVASGVNVPNAELFDYVERRWGCRINPLSQARPPAVAQVDTGRLREELEWRPSPVFEVMARWPGALAC